MARRGGQRRSAGGPIRLLLFSLVLAVLSLGLPGRAWAQDDTSVDKLTEMAEGVITFYDPSEPTAEPDVVQATEPGTEAVAGAEDEAAAEEETASGSETAAQTVAAAEGETEVSTEADTGIQRDAKAAAPAEQPACGTPAQELAETSASDVAINTSTSKDSKSIVVQDAADQDDDGLRAHEDAAVLVRLAPGSTDAQLANLVSQACKAGVSLDATEVAQEDLDFGTVRLRIADGTSVADTISLLSPLSGVLTVQPNYRYRVSSIDAASVYNDPQSLSDWLIPSVHGEEAWDMVRTQGSAGVAVIDTGVDETHPDLAANIVARHNATSSKYATTDYLGHGTHVAGLIAGVAGNGVGVAGTSFNAKLVIIKASPSDDNSFDTASIVRAFAWLLSLDESGTTVAKHYNVRVVNMSIGGVDEDDAANQPDDEINAAMWRAREAGILVVCAAGNKGSKDGPYATYPGDSDACLSVMNLTEVDLDDDDEDEGESDEGDEEEPDDGLDDEEEAPTTRVALSKSSNYNKPGTRYKDICAPGTFVRSTWKGGKYAYDSGTSMAAPVVSGIAALLFAANPGLTPDGAIAILEETATDLGEPGWDETYGYGEVNAEAAVRMALDACIDGPDMVGLGQASGFTAQIDSAPLGTDGWSWSVARDGGSAKAAAWGGDEASVDTQKGGVTVVRGKTLGDVVLTATCKTAAGAEICVRKTVSVVSTAIAGVLEVAAGATSQLQGSLMQLVDVTAAKSEDDGAQMGYLRPGWHWEVHNLGDGGWATIDEQGVLTAVSTGTVDVRYVCSTNTSLFAEEKVKILAA